MAFSPERLIRIRESLGLNKAETAALLHMPPMTYGRYENGKRTPSYQMICYMAQVLRTSYAYLCEESEDSSPSGLLVSRDEAPQLYELVQHLSFDSSAMHRRLLSYYLNISDVGQSNEEE